jgi:hypothetical protein
VRCSPILRPKRERTTAKKTARDAPTRNEMGELVVDWGDPIQRQRSGGMLQNSIRPRGLTVQGGQTIAIPPRLPSGSTRSSGSFVWREASGPNSVLSALDRKARISASSPRCALWPLSRHHSARKAGPFPGDIEMETRITAIIRWNALAMGRARQRNLWRTRRSGRQLRHRRRDF